MAPAGFSRRFCAQCVQSTEQDPLTVSLLCPPRALRRQEAVGLGPSGSSWLCSLAGLMSGSLCPGSFHTGASSRVSSRGDPGSAHGWVYPTPCLSMELASWGSRGTFHGQHTPPFPLGPLSTSRRNWGPVIGMDVPTSCLQGCGLPSETGP